jgi:hypothetical protein
MIVARFCNNQLRAIPGPMRAYELGIKLNTAQCACQVGTVSTRTAQVDSHLRGSGDFVT